MENNGEKTLEKLDEIKVILSKILESEKITSVHPMDLFHKSLNNAQPIAFLASLSIVIAAFTFSNEELQSVSTYAVVAGFMFLFSFIASLGNQINLVKQDDDNYEYYEKISRYGSYAFLSIGIGYLLLLAYEFGKSLPEIYLLTSGYVMFFAGGFAIFAVVKFRVPNINQYQGIQKGYYVIETTLVALLGEMMIFIGLSKMTEMFFSFKIESFLPAYFLIGLFSVLGLMTIVRRDLLKK